MIACGVDPGVKHFGVSVLDLPAHRLLYGMSHPLGGGRWRQWPLRVWDILDRLHAEHGFTRVGMESPGIIFPRRRMKDPAIKSCLWSTAHEFVTACSTLQWCHEREVQCVDVQANNLKLWATSQCGVPSRNADKMAMRLALEKSLGMTSPSSHVVDAAWAAHYAVHHGTSPQSSEWPEGARRQ